MKKWGVIQAVALCLFTLEGFASTVAFLDEGINTDKTWRASNLAPKQRCRSLITEFSGLQSAGNLRVATGSLCKKTVGGTANYNDSVIYFNSDEAAEIKKTIVYRPSDNGTFIDLPITLKRTFSDGSTGFLYHGNYVSNAAYNFDTTILHMPFQVFGLDRRDDTKPDKFVTSNSSEFPSENERSGKHIVDALQELAFDENSNGEIGAVSISIVLKGGLAPVTAEELCINGDGQDQVNRLYERGIAVVTGLANNDIGVDELTWPQCLDKVINVGSQAAHSAANQPGHQIGIGANGIHFFAKDTTTNAPTGTRGNRRV